MKKTSLSSFLKGLTVCLVFVLGLSVYQTNSNNGSVSVSMQSASATEEPPVVITCNNGGYGQCYNMQMIDCWPVPAHQFKCTFTGYQSDSCSWIAETFCNAF